MNYKALLRLGMDFIRRNDTKILAIGTAVLSVITTTVAVKTGMKAKEALDEANAELPEGEELSSKEKTKIIAKNVAPAVVSTVVEVGGIAMLFRRGKMKAAGAMAIASFCQNKLITKQVQLVVDGASDTQNKDSPEESDSGILMARKHIDVSDIPFDIYEPLSGQTIYNCTSGKLSLAEYWLNKNVEFGYKMYLDDLIMLIGGHRLPPWKEHKWCWTNSVDITEYTAHMYWVDFFFTTDDKGRYVLTFSRLPAQSNEATLLDNMIS